MIFRYDFDKQFDLSKFRNQTLHYISTIDNIEYDIFVRDFQVIFNIKHDSLPFHNFNIKIFSLKRNNKNEIIQKIKLFPLAEDSILNNCKDIIDLYIDQYCCEANIVSNDFKYTVNKMCNIIKILYKINKLKIFC
jgi:hypothetical protein